MDGNYFWTLWLLVEEMEGFWKTTILLEMEKQETWINNSTQLSEGDKL